jgi:hypothetical protein
VVITNEYRCYSGQGQSFSVEGLFGWSSGAYDVTASEDSSLICGAGRYMSCGRLRYKQGNSGTVAFTDRGDVLSADIRGLALTPDGSRLYLSHWNQLGFSAYDTRSMSALPIRGGGAGLYSDLVAVGVDGRLYGVGHKADGSNEVWVFDDAGASLASHRLTPPGRTVRDVGVSSDGKRFVVLTSSPTLELFSTP